MARWSKWRPIDDIYEDVNLLHRTGLYQIRMVDNRGSPLTIPRIKGKDANGILYMGKSVNLRPRIEAFYRGGHSGGGYYYRMYLRLVRYRPFRNHSLQFRTMSIQKSNLLDRERGMLQGYLRKFCELPPYNSTVPGGK